MKKQPSLETMSRDELLSEVRKLRRQLRSFEPAPPGSVITVDSPPSDGDIRLLLDESSDPTFIVREDGTCIYANKVFAESVGRKASWILGRNIADCFRENELNPLSSLLKWVIENQETKVMDTRIHQKDGDHYYISTAKPLLNKQEDLEVIICTSKEITNRKKIEEELRFVISHDTLTGLYNRHFFQTELQRLQNSRQFPVSVIMLDVDRLDSINKTYGRKAGDDLLIKASTVLKEIFRKEEVIARVGGDEFAILLPETGEHALSDILARMNRDIDKAGDSLLRLTCSSATAKEGDSLTRLMELVESRRFENKTRLAG